MALNNNNKCYFTVVVVDAFQNANLRYPKMANCSLAALENWIASGGGFTRPISLAQFALPQLPSVKERGLQALEPIPKGGLILAVPTQAFMGTRAALDSRRSSIAGALTSHPHLFGSASSTLALFLLAELRRAESSYYAPYLRCLPRAGTAAGDEEAEVSTLLWGESQLEQLQVAPGRASSECMIDALTAAQHPPLPC